jgi:hypothetical protein
MVQRWEGCGVGDRTRSDWEIDVDIDGEASNYEGLASNEFERAGKIRENICCVSSGGELSSQWVFGLINI